MKFQPKAMFYSVVIVALLSAVTIIFLQFKSQQQTNINIVKPKVAENILYVQKIISNQESKTVISTQPQFIVASSGVRSEKVAAITDLTPETWWMQNTSLSENRWLLLIPRTMESRPEARLIDLDQKIAERRIALPFEQTGDIQNSNYGDIITNGFYDVLRQAIVYLVRRNVMTATEGAGITEKNSVAEIWSQPVNGGEESLIFSVNAKPIALQNEQKQYDLPEMIQSAKDGVYYIWRGEVGVVTYEQETKNQIFASTLDKEQTSVFLNLHISPTGEKYILEQQDHTGVSTTNLYRIEPNNRSSLLKAFTNFTNIRTWRFDGSQVVMSSGADGSLSILDIPTGKESALTINKKSDVILLSWLIDTRLFTTTFSTLDSETGWYSMLDTYDIGTSESVPISVQGLYWPL